jgi:hypothetical protein
MATILFSVAAHLAETAYLSLTVYSDPMQKDQMKAAEGLQSMGLRAGDPVEIVGDGTAAYWAAWDDSGSWRKFFLRMLETGGSGANRGNAGNWPTNM